MRVYRTGQIGVACALLAAALFGASTPLAKLLLAQIEPWLLAALLYLGSGIGLYLARRVMRSKNADAESDRLALAAARGALGRYRCTGTTAIWFAGHDRLGRIATAQR